LKAVSHFATFAATICSQSLKHQQGVVHHALKFENIVFEHNGPDAGIKVTDFGHGIARRFQSGRTTQVNESGFGVM
jgi:serine/threonine protein kinase